MSGVKVFVTVCGRPVETESCLDSLIMTTANLSANGRPIAPADLVVFNMTPAIVSPGLSDDDKQGAARIDAVLDAVANLGRGMVVHAPHAAIGSVYWSKNWAWRVFLSMFDALSWEDEGLDGDRVVVMVDNDVVFRPGWLSSSLQALLSMQAADARVAVVSPYDGAPRYPADYCGEPTPPASLLDKSGRVADLDGVPCYIRRAAVSRCWVMRAAVPFMFEPDGPFDEQVLVPESLGGPGVGSPPQAAAVPSCRLVMRDGRRDRVPTDWWYWQRFAAAKLRFGVLADPLVVDPPGSWRSARHKAGVGADCAAMSETPNF